MEWIIAIIVVAVIAWVAFTVVRRSGRRDDGPSLGEPGRDDPGVEAGDDPGPPGEPDPDGGTGPRRERHPGDGFD